MNAHQRNVMAQRITDLILGVERSVCGHADRIAFKYRVGSKEWEGGGLCRSSLVSLIDSGLEHCLADESVILSTLNAQERKALKAAGVDFGQAGQSRS